VRERREERKIALGLPAVLITPESKERGKTDGFPNQN